MRETRKQRKNRRMDIRPERILGISIQEVSETRTSGKSRGFSRSSEKVVSSSNAPSNVDTENYVSSVVGIHTHILRGNLNTFKSL